VRAHRWTLCALLAVGVGAAGCAETSSDAAPSVAGDLAGDGEAVATALEVTATDHHFTMSATTVAEGVVPIELVNQGAWPHQVLVARLADGQTMEDYLAAFEEGEVAADDLITHAGGVNIVDPGTSSVGYADLAPGRYVVLCFIPGEHGESHLMDGMIAELTVVDDERVPAPSDPVGEISLVDFGFGLPDGGLAAPGTYRVTNGGQQTHEMAIMRVDDGAALGDVAAYLQGGFKGESPVTFVGGAGGIEAGKDGYVDLDLEPGTYLAMCFLTDEASGKRHVELGMLTQLEVG
jgi:uncharacterized cupredoxin-like copper-binding protein